MSPFPTVFSKDLYCRHVKPMACMGKGESITRQQILDSSRLKEFADDNFKFDKNDRKLSKQVENTVGKGEIDCYEQFLLYPQCFQKTCFLGASKGVVVLEWVKAIIRLCLKQLHFLVIKKDTHRFISPSALPAGIAQLVKVFDLKTRGCGFDSLPNNYKLSFG